VGLQTPHMTIRAPQEQPPTTSLESLAAQAVQRAPVPGSTPPEKLLEAPYIAANPLERLETIGLPCELVEMEHILL
jgi:hypothetical protein